MKSVRSKRCKQIQYDVVTVITDRCGRITGKDCGRFYREYDDTWLQRTGVNFCKVVGTNSSRQKKIMTKNEILIFSVLIWKS
jgi:hypothetical protein